MNKVMNRESLSIPKDSAQHDQEMREENQTNVVSSHATVESSHETVDSIQDIVESSQENEVFTQYKTMKFVRRTNLIPTKRYEK